MSEGWHNVKVIKFALKFWFRTLTDETLAVIFPPLKQSFTCWLSSYTYAFNIAPVLLLCIYAMCGVLNLDFKDINGKSAPTSELTTEKIKIYWRKDQATFQRALLTYRVSSWEAKCKIALLEVGKLERSWTSLPQRPSTAVSSQDRKQNAV